MKKETLSFRNIPIAINTNGKEGKTPVVFVHGNSMSGKIWQKQFDSALSDNYFLLAPDITGFGDSGHSDKPDADYNLSDLGDALIAVIAHYKLRNYILAGHSLGGNIILQSLAKIKNCKGILTIGTPPIRTAADMAKMFMPNPEIGAMFQKDYDEKTLQALQGIFFTSSLTTPGFFVDDFKKADGMVRQTIGSNVAEGKFINEINELVKQNIRVAFASGKNERAVNNDYFSLLDPSIMWKGKLHLIDNSCHCPQWENADEFNNLIEEFIADVTLL
ncbi:MAG: alpha/beta fold hydrolase [Bacteroidia bacterium]